MRQNPEHSFYGDLKAVLRWTSSHVLFPVWKISKALLFKTYDAIIDTFWSRPADLFKWDTKHEFSLYEAAFLWEDLEPTWFYMPGRVKKRYYEIENAVRAGVISPPFYGQSQNEKWNWIVYEFRRGRTYNKFKPDPNMKIRKAAFQMYASSQNHKPAFLFPKERV